MNTEQALELAILPLADGRQIALPLLVLAEVKQLPSTPGEEALGEISWRGHELPVEALDEFCGLPPAARERYTTVGIFRADRDAAEPFRALAFCGLAAHRLAAPADLDPAELPPRGNFSAAATMDGTTLLVPDLSPLDYPEGKSRLH